MNLFAETNASGSPLAGLEPRLRYLLPANLYAQTWIDPSPANLMRVFEHLRTLQRTLSNYTPPHVAALQSAPGILQAEWQTGTLMFTDLAGFTPLLEANAAHGAAGAASLLKVLNDYFATLIDILSKSGGSLLEFTGDAILALFPEDPRTHHTAMAIRAGLRMQRAMARFAAIETPGETLALQMRVGIHSGRFLSALIGTPRRMEPVLLGTALQIAKQTETDGMIERVAISHAAARQISEQFRLEVQQACMLVCDDFSDDQLGQYDVSMRTCRTAAPVVMDRSVPALLSTIEETLRLVEPLASYLPFSILNLVVESAAQRQIAPRFTTLIAMFVNLPMLSDVVERAAPEELPIIVQRISQLFALINSVVEANGGILKNVTSHHTGSDMLIYFGVPNAHVDSMQRAAATALEIRRLITTALPFMSGGRRIAQRCQIGIAGGAAFAAEIGEPRGRREFNVLGDPVNTAARLMDYAADNEILINETAYAVLQRDFHCTTLGAIQLKGKSPIPVFALHTAID